MFFRSKACQVLLYLDRQRIVSPRIFCVKNFRTDISFYQDASKKIFSLDSDANARYNPINIQMLSSGLYKQIFGKVSDLSIEPEVLKNVTLHLSKHGLLGAVSFMIAFIKTLMNRND